MRPQATDDDSLGAVANRGDRQVGMQPRLRERELGSVQIHQRADEDLERGRDERARDGVADGSRGSGCVRRRQ